MSISLHGQISISQSSRLTNGSFSSQGINDKSSFKNFYNLYLFPLYDEILRIIKLSPFFSVLLIIILLSQISKTFSNFSDNNFTGFFTNFCFNLTYSAISFPFLYLIINLFFFTYIFLSYRSRRMFSYWQLYIISLILNFFNVIFFPPICGVCGYSVVMINNQFSSQYINQAPQPNTQNIVPQMYYSKSILFNNSYLKNEINNQYTQNNNHENNIFLDYIKNGKETNDIKDKNVIKKQFPNYIYNNTNTINDAGSMDENKKKIDFVDTKISPKSIFLTKFQNKNKHKIHILNGSNNQISAIDPNNRIEKNSDQLQYNSDFHKYTFSLILSLFEAIFLYIQIIINFHFVSESPYLNRTIFSMWDGKVFTISIAILGINQFSSNFIIIFPKWCTSVYILILFLLDIYALYYTFFQPFINIWVNSFFQAFLTFELISSVLYFVYSIKAIEFLLNIISFLFFAILLFFFIYYFINKKIIDIVHHKLSPQTIKLESGGSSQYDTQFESSEEESYNKKKKPLFSSRKDNENEHYYEMTDQEKREMFDKYVFQSIDHAFLYFRVGILRYSPFFIDFSFLRYMKETYGQNPIQFAIVQLAALFPSQRQFFNYCITSLSKRDDFFNMYEQFVMYQIHRINIVRQSTVSKEVSNEIIRLDNMADESISAIRGFWAEILQTKTDFNTASLGFIRTMTLNTRSCFIDAIEKFPNSTQILNSYCRFLCESCGDYIECIRIGQRIRLIERGRFENTDFCYRSFVNVFPQYLKKRILDEKGLFIYNNNSSLSTQSSTTMSSTKLSQSFDTASSLQSMKDNVKSTSNIDYAISTHKRNKNDFENVIEQENYDTLINNLFTHGKARLSIQQIVDQSRNHGLIVACLISVAQFICFSIVILLIFGYIVNFHYPTQLVSNSARTSKIILSLQYCSLIAGIQYLSEIYNISFSSKIVNYLNIREDNMPYFPCTFYRPMIALDQTAKKITSLLDEEIKFMLSKSSDHYEEMGIYSGFELNDSDYYFQAKQLDTQTESNDRKKSVKDDDYYYDNSFWENGVYMINYNDQGATRFKTSLRNGLESFESKAERLAFEYANTINQVQNNYNPPLRNLTQFHHIYSYLLMNGLTLSQPFFHLFDVISANGIKNIESTEKLVGDITTILAIVCFIVFFALRVFAFCKIKETIKNITMIIKKVKCEDIIEAMKPIFLKSKKGIKIHSTSNHSIYDYSPSLILYPLISIISILACLVFFLIMALHFKSLFSFIRNSQKWENDSASRFLSLAVLMNGMIAQSIEALNYTISDTILHEALQVMEITQSIDLSIIAKGKKLSEYYYMVDDDATISSFKYQHVEIQKPTQKKVKSNKFLSFSKQNSKFKKILDSKTQESVNLKCTELDNGNISKQMNFATYLDCISINNKVNLVIHFYSLLEDDYRRNNIIFNPDFISTLFIIDKYLYQELPEFHDKIAETTKKESKKEKNKVVSIGVGGIATIFVFTLLELLVIMQIYYSYNAFKQLIKILPPVSYTNNTFLINFLIQSSTSFSISSIAYNPRAKVSSEVEILVNSIDNGIITTDKKLIIQSVNPAVQKMTGFLPDQLLGQGLLYLIPLTSKYDDANVSFEKYPFYQRLSEIQSSNGDRVAELTAKVSTEKGDEILTRATIIGVYDKKRKTDATTTKSYTKNHHHHISNEIFDDEEDYDSNTATTTTTTTTTTNTINNANAAKYPNILNDDEIEEFAGATIILQDISNERELKKHLKDAKRKNEILLNLLIPQPVLENIRESRKSAFYTSKMATVINIELTGFDDYLGTIVPKQIMNNIQIILNEIDEIKTKDKDSYESHELFVKENKQSEQNDSNAMISNFIQQSQHSILRFNFNFTSSADEDYKISKFKNKNDDDDDDDGYKKISINEFISNRSIRSQNGIEIQDEYEFEDHDEFCDFNCIYNIRNDNDKIISIAGLFDSQDELQKQAESCVRYALKVKHIIENIGLEDQINIFIHVRIAVCMGGPVNGFVEDPENPNFQIFTDLLKETDMIKNAGDVDAVYINENVYNNLIKENYEIEEIILLRVYFKRSLKTSKIS